MQIVSESECALLLGVLKHTMIFFIVREVRKHKTLKKIYQQESKYKIGDLGSLNIEIIYSIVLKYSSMHSADSAVFSLPFSILVKMSGGRQNLVPNNNKPFSSFSCNFEYTAQRQL